MTTVDAAIIKALVEHIGSDIQVPELPVIPDEEGTVLPMITDSMLTNQNLSSVNYNGNVWTRAQTGFTNGFKIGDFLRFRKSDGGFETIMLIDIMQNASNGNVTFTFATTAGTEINAIQTRDSSNGAVYTLTFPSGFADYTVSDADTKTGQFRINYNAYPMSVQNCLNMVLLACHSAVSRASTFQATLNALQQKVTELTNYHKE